ncbi:MAG: fibronectin type III domain-containing protein [Bacteroidetes bacterium]|nr:fibronectin type III domain-containing protein [Bacteroidota bacterium]
MRRWLWRAAKLKKKGGDGNSGKKIVAYVQVQSGRRFYGASGGDAVIIESANMFVQDSNAPDHGIPTQVQHLSLSHHDLFGHIDAHWDAVHHYGHVWYNIRYTFTDPLGGGTITWVPFDHDVSSTTIDFSDPAHAGQIVWFEVRAVNAAGAGEWSVAVPIIISSGVPAP